MALNFQGDQDLQEQEQDIYTILPRRATGHKLISIDEGSGRVCYAEAERCYHESTSQSHCIGFCVITPMTRPGSLRPSALAFKHTLSMEIQRTSIVLIL